MSNSYETATVTPELPASLFSPFALEYLKGCGFSHEGEGMLYFYAEEFAGGYEGEQTVQDALDNVETCPVAKLVAASLSSDAEANDLLTDYDRLPDYVEVFQLFADKAEKKEIVIEGGYWNDKARPGEFGGWVARVTPEKVQVAGMQDLLRMMREGKI
jgi:hypothetical protein